VVFGHWAALEGYTGHKRFIGLDTGCVWGGALTLIDLDSEEITCCDC
jgi:bis(5'-nucleosyl)-tetraphosphatase (symmetrical)